MGLIRYNHFIIDRRNEKDSAMSNEQEQLTVRRLADFAEVERLYRERLKKDFARNELRPLANLRRSWEKDAYDCYSLVDGDEILGYAFFARLGNNFLFDYFAVAEGHRDEGLGSLFLRCLAAHLRDADCVVVEVEDPDRAKEAAEREIRERRLQFYLRAGYRKTGLTSVLFGAEYRILEVPAKRAHTTDELREIYTALCRSVLSPVAFRTQFRVF